MSFFDFSFQQKLEEKQIQLGLKQHKLISDVATRWGSTFQIIDRILEQQNAIIMLFWQMIVKTGTTC